MDDNKPKMARMWDLPVRLFHILIIILVSVQWYTGENMGIATPDLVDAHIASGCTILALVLFRIIWGFIGSTTARFSHFLKGPKAALQYLKKTLKRDEPIWVGHNPVGGLSVLLMLAFLLVLPLLGLFSADDEIPGFGPSGPLSHRVSDDTSYELAGLHHELWEIFSIWILIHLVAILFYRIHKQHNLIGPMITGKADVDGAETLKFRPPWLAVIVLAITSGAVALAVTQL